MEPFHSAFGKKNKVFYFFLLKSRIERSRSILYLVREPYECRGEETSESTRIRSFLWSESIPATYNKFPYEDPGAVPLLFVGLAVCPYVVTAATYYNKIH
jgi:hypothetical protein